MISCVIACMNRTDRLEKMLPTWAKIENIKDIVVVDWSSKIPIIENENIQKFKILLAYMINKRVIMNSGK